MILATAVVLGLVASVARHGRDAFRRVARIPLHSAWLALVAVALQIPLLRAPPGPTQDLGLQRALYLASFLLLLAFVWRNRRIPGILIVGIGVICNLLVILFNGGFMPITPETLVEINPGSTVEQWPIGTHYGYSKDVIELQHATKFWALSDTLVVPPPFPRPTAFSVGDLVIAAGIVVLMQGAPVQADASKDRPLPDKARNV
ncbi:DUF5317 domain-containing protein [Chloroflexota bacterium]